MTENPDVQPDPFGDEPGAGSVEEGPVEEGELDLDDDPGDGIISRAFDGDRDGPSVSELRDQYGLGREAGIAGRGIARMATGAGIPPILEIATGAGLATLKLSNDGPLDDEPTEDDTGRAPVGGQGIER